MIIRILANDRRHTEKKNLQNHSTSFNEGSTEFGRRLKLGNTPYNNREVHLHPKKVNVPCKIQKDKQISNLKCKHAPSHVLPYPFVT